MLLSVLGYLVAFRVALAAQNPSGNQVITNRPTSPNASQIFQERLSDNDYVWFGTTSGGEQFYSSTERIGWRLKNDDASTVIHMVRKHFDKTLGCVTC